ncbi:MAG: hypothetical protein DWH91_07430 [Planctomycetota bacterium]|nr:MAG: hypothetical protein DWH91_07430 [Planctomycetota bacterium]
MPEFFSESLSRPVLAAGDASVGAAIPIVMLMIYGIFVAVRALFVLAGVMAASRFVLPKKSRFTLRQGLLISLVHSCVAGIALFVIFLAVVILVKVLSPQEPAGLRLELKVWWFLLPVWIFVEHLLFTKALSKHADIGVSHAKQVSMVVHAGLAFLWVLALITILVLLRGDGKGPL